MGSLNEESSEDEGDGIHAYLGVHLYWGVVTIRSTLASALADGDGPLI